MHLDRFNKVWAEIMDYFTYIVDFFKNLFGLAKKDEEEGE